MAIWDGKEEAKSLMVKLPLPAENTESIIPENIVVDKKKKEVV